MSKIRTILVKGNSISIDENNYISLTDMASIEDYYTPGAVQRWFNDSQTLKLLSYWETMYNEDFILEEMVKIQSEITESNLNITPEIYQKRTGGIGVISKSGLYSKIFAHPDIAITFCHFRPVLQVYLMKEFNRLKEEEERNVPNWHISKIMDDVDNFQTLLDATNNISSSEKKP